MTPWCKQVSRGGGGLSLMLTHAEPFPLPIANSRETQNLAPTGAESSSFPPP